MTLSYPLTLPSDFASDQAFEPERDDYLSPENSGRLGAVQAGSTLWRGVWTISTALGVTRAEAVRAFLAALDGPQQLFYGFDQARPLPLLYPSGFAGLVRPDSSAFDGTATSWSIDGTGKVLTLSGLPVGFQLSIGDYVGFSWTTSSQPRRDLVRAVEAVTANGSGVAVVTVRKELDAAVPGGAVATLNRPNCLMRLDPAATQLAPMQRRKAISGTISALQEIKA